MLEFIAYYAPFILIGFLFIVFFIALYNEKHNNPKK